MKCTDEILLAFVDADEAHRPQRTQFFVAGSFSADPGAEIVHPGLPENFRCDVQDVEELDRLGYLRTIERKGVLYFDVTEAGFTYAERLKLAMNTAEAASAADESKQNPLDWETRVLPVLAAVGRAYVHGNPDLGLSLAMVNAELGRDANHSSTQTVLGELVRSEYLEETLGADELSGPAWCRLQEKGLQVTAGWPSASGEVALDRLLSIIEDRIAAAPDDEERSKWEKLRDGILGVGRDVVVGAITTSVNAAAKGLF